MTTRTHEANPFLAGHAAGLRGQPTPHPPKGSKQYIRWMCGYNAAQQELKRDAERAKALEKELARG